MFKYVCTFVILSFKNASSVEVGVSHLQLQNKCFIKIIFNNIWKIQILGGTKYIREKHGAYTVVKTVIQLEH